MWKWLAILVILFVFIPKSALAIYDPLSVSNNRFGIHIIDENDLEEAAQLLNSSNGDWGYVKIVITEQDRNTEKWQTVFDKMRELRLIPIVRLATRVENGAWVRPDTEDIREWVDFLNQLNWVVENRYIVLFNEPNHAKEWGDRLEPEEYAKLVKEFSVQLKSASPDFFVLPAGLDASAPQTHETLDELIYLRRMIAAVPDFFDYIDGWSSHSYPNPGFSGSPLATGRGSVRTFDWETTQLRALGLSKQLPIFILETGWRHSQGKTIESAYITPETAAEYFTTAYERVWNDPRIVAVVPFLLNYQDAPFDHFSWKKLNSSEFYPMFSEIQNMPKSKGAPRQHLSATLLNSTIPQKVINKSHYVFTIDIENTGQAIIDPDDGWKIDITGLPEEFEWKIDSELEAKPYHRTKVKIDLITPDGIGKFQGQLRLLKNDLVVTELPIQLELIPPPSLVVRVIEWVKRKVDTKGMRIVIYDSEEQVVHEVEDAIEEDGRITLPEIRNIIPFTTYRVVVTKKYYLPRQAHVQIGEINTEVDVGRLMPFDPSGDGKLSWGDIPAYFKNPLAFWVRLLP